MPFLEWLLGTVSMLLSKCEVETPLGLQIVNNMYSKLLCYKTRFVRVLVHYWFFPTADADCTRDIFFYCLFFKLCLAI